MNNHESILQTILCMILALIGLAMVPALLDGTFREMLADQPSLFSVMCFGVVMVAMVAIVKLLTHRPYCPPRPRFRRRRRPRPRVTRITHVTIRQPRR